MSPRPSSRAAKEPEGSFRLQARLLDDPFGDLAILANEAGEFFEPCARRLDRPIDEHPLPKLALLDDARDFVASLAMIGFGVPAGANRPNQVEG
jgi:hypothetical protein